MVTLRDVARKTGLSPATISRVLRASGPVAAGTRTLVLSAVEELGYRPNPLAQGLRVGRSNTIALVLSDIEQGWFASLAKHLQIGLEEIGVDLVLMNLGHKVRRLDDLVERVQTMRMRGLILALTDRIPDRQVRRIVNALDKDVSVLSVGQRLDRFGIPSIVHADTEAAEAAVGYLLEQDRWPVAYCSRIRVSTMGAERFEGYRRALEAAGHALDERLVWDYSDEPHFRQAAGYQRMAEALDQGIHFRSVLAGSDEIALGAMAAALDRGLRVPEDIAIIGFGGLEWGNSVRPRLTTLTSDLQGLSESVRAFFGQQKAEANQRQPLLTVLQRELALRASA